jgi:hypothetical protein
MGGRAAHKCRGVAAAYSGRIGEEGCCLGGSFGTLSHRRTTFFDFLWALAFPRETS